MNKVDGWMGKWLSKGGKEVLIKSILLALRHMLCLVSFSRWRYVKTSQVPLHNSGGVQIHQRDEFIVQNGKNSAYQNKRI